MIPYLPFIGSAISKIFGSKEKRDQFQANARSAVYSQFAAEFGHSKTWWDSLIDGLNRLPRPLMTFGTIYLFYMCWTDYERFLVGAVALQSMPKEGWYILGAIVTFWFAAKLPKDFGKHKKEYGDSPPFVMGGVTEQKQDSDWKDRIKRRYNE